MRMKGWIKSKDEWKWKDECKWIKRLMQMNGNE